MKEKVGEVFSIAKENPPIPGCTISKEVQSGENYITYFSLARNTDINGMMKDLSVLQEAPFNAMGSVVEVFTDLAVWMGIRKVIEQVHANALAA